MRYMRFTQKNFKKLMGQFQDQEWIWRALLISPAYASILKFRIV